MTIDIPQDSFIQETIPWQANVPDHGSVSHTFYLVSVYGTGTTEQEILNNNIGVIVSGKVDTVSKTRSDPITTYIGTDVFPGIYSCATFISEGVDVNMHPIGIYHSRVDSNVMNVVESISAIVYTPSWQEI